MEQSGLAPQLDEELFGGFALGRGGQSVVMVLDRGDELGATLVEQVDDFGALEIVGFGEGDAELARPVDAGQFGTHPFFEGPMAGIQNRVGGAFRSIAVAIDAGFGEESVAFEAGDRVVDRALLQRDEPVVAAFLQQAHELVRVHVGLAERGQDHDGDGGEAAGLQHPSSSWSVSTSPRGLYAVSPRLANPHG